MDEPAWERIEPFPMTMYTPTFGDPITEPTELRVAYDDRHLYVAGRMYDSEPGRIRANTYYRDQYSADDLLAFIIDTYNDYDTGLWFAVNPLGTRIDRTISNDAEFLSGDPMNVNWNAHWEVEVSRDDAGWYAEFRIPFSSLGFQDDDGVVTMGFIAYRFIARKNERQIYPAIPPDWSLGFAKPSQAQRITLRDVRAGKPVYVTPYALTGVERLPRLHEEPDSGAEWVTDTDGDFEVGGGLKYSPASNLALDLTVNTDFAQVESDAQQVNLTRFALFFPEKRQFFQERASIFEFNTGGPNNRLFHSRRIGLGPDGQPIRIYGGARLVGRIGATDIGFLNMQTAESEFLPAENIGVLRVRSRLFNRYSTAGGMLTTRLGSDGSSNVAYGADATLRVTGDEYVTLKWAQTFDDSVDTAGVWNTSLSQARWERRSDAGLSYFADLRRAGPGYTPALGFQSRSDFTVYGAQLQYRWFQGTSSPFRSIALLGYSGNYIRNSDDSAESRALEPKIELELKSGATLAATLLTSYESVREPFPIGDVVIPVGDYWFHEGQLSVELPRGGLFRGGVTASAGSFFDGTRLALASDPSWNVSRHLELGSGYEVNRIERDDGPSTTTHLARLRIQLALDTRISLSTFLQYNSTVDLTSVNARFRYHFREGTDLWLVYDEGINTVRDLPGVPRMPGSAFRSLQLKYTHTLSWD
ncbi:MAG: DUF5916 domain-containing protein [Gemmatimonadota bacterium]|nr:DUF5916 domain-containing protein [Gemmatimonadota bacterium]